MTSIRARLVAVTTASSLALGVVACGGETPTAASCADSWNADANADQQPTLAGALAADISLNGQFRVGMWSSAEQTVPVTDGFAEKPSAEAVVPKNSCLLVFPPSHVGQMAFFEAKGKWRFVRDNTGSEFPAAARRELSGAKVATPDALGKLKLG